MRDDSAHQNLGAPSYSRFLRIGWETTPLSRRFTKTVASFFVIAILSLVPLALAAAKGKGVEVIANEAARRVDITIDGKPFTPYMWPTTLKKPVLYPLIDSDGVTVTRGYPLAPLAGERVDHPHHAGMWFNYGNANGFDFWNNSDAIKPELQPKMGTVVIRRIVSTKSGADRGELVVDSAWIDGRRQQILEQTDALCVCAAARPARDRPDRHA